MNTKPRQLIDSKSLSNSKLDINSLNNSTNSLQHQTNSVLSSNSKNPDNVDAFLIHDYSSNKKVITNSKPWNQKLFENVEIRTKNQIFKKSNSREINNSRENLSINNSKENLSSNIFEPKNTFCLKSRRKNMENYNCLTSRKSLDSFNSIKNDIIKQLDSKKSKVFRETTMMVRDSVRSRFKSQSKNSTVLQKNIIITENFLKNNYFSIFL